MIVVTAGHVDHGKSTLVRLITGTDPDRLPEERRRGMSIGLGFCFTRLPSGRTAAFVDVPGHQRFVRTMVSGCTEGATALLAVSAAEGWKPQTEEHVQILRFLGVESCVVALTNVDRLSDRSQNHAVGALGERLSGTPFSTAPIVRTSSNNPTGIVELVRMLDAVTDRSTEDRLGGLALEAAESSPRLWIDRSFIAKGFGRVVTGTLQGGAVSQGQELLLVSRSESAGVRVRSIRENGLPVEVAMPNNRVAFNLAGGVPVSRGDALVLEGGWSPAGSVCAMFQSARGTDTPAASRSLRLFVGSASWPVRLKYLDSADGSAGLHLVRLRFPAPIGPVDIGDRYVLRDESDQRTVGGGVFLGLVDFVPRRSLGDMWARAMIATDPQLGPRAVRRIAAGQELMEQPRSDPPVGEVSGASGAKRTPAFETFVRAAPLLTPADFYLTSGYTPADLGGLLQAGTLVEVGPFLTSRQMLEMLEDEVLGHLRRNGPATVAELRDATSLTRRFLVPLLEYLDLRGSTRRVGDVRFAGRR